MNDETVKRLIVALLVWFYGVLAVGLTYGALHGPVVDAEITASEWVPVLIVACIPAWIALVAFFGWLFWQSVRYVIRGNLSNR
jgi:hypothetical protein